MFLITLIKKNKEFRGNKSEGEKEDDDEFMLAYIIC